MTLAFSCWDGQDLGCWVRFERAERGRHMAVSMAGHSAGKIYFQPEFPKQIAGWVVCPRQIFYTFCAQSKTTAKKSCVTEMGHRALLELQEKSKSA